MRVAAASAAASVNVSLNVIANPRLEGRRGARGAGRGGDRDCAWPGRAALPDATSWTPEGHLPVRGSAVVPALPCEQPYHAYKLNVVIVRVEALHFFLSIKFSQILGLFCLPGTHMFLLFLLLSSLILIFASSPTLTEQFADENYFVLLYFPTAELFNYTTHTCWVLDPT